MCEWGKTVSVEVTIPADLNHTGSAYRKEVGIDECIAPLIQALNDAGVVTVASCCGHGKGPGRIALGDGRELVIVPDFRTAEKVAEMLKEDEWRRL